MAAGTIAFVGVPASSDLTSVENNALASLSNAFGTSAPPSWSVFSPDTRSDLRVESYPNSWQPGSTQRGGSRPLGSQHWGQCLDGDGRRSALRFR